MTFWKKYSLGIILFLFFLSSWIAQGIVQIAEVTQQARDHGSRFMWSEWWVEFARATFENWQSEFLQLLTFVLLTRWFRFQGSHESKAPEYPDEKTG
jgi:hypothetical protein